ncbi:hypothetical protein BN2476_750093 [Paraburkholderia piptadeniae]|uniref:Uncharacterized protein n=1 Tax=Paraburkholderia piptadeniae TaxID=1701573 RepID=A0A1N7SS50_9BURK|nr:hypothetical protein BN2476_750093 [Paraburkholderia piptadeniae]
MSPPNPRLSAQPRRNGESRIPRVHRSRRDRLKVLGTVAAEAALSTVGHSNGSVPNPCKPGF